VGHAVVLVVGFELLLAFGRDLTCLAGYSGVDCSVKSVCIGLNNGYYCINDTYIDCINQQS
jgi:hypothetical protein